MSNSAFTITGAGGGGGGSGTVTAVGTGTGLTGGPITTSGTISIDVTGVSAGSYTNADITVNAEGQITAASNGAAGSVTSITAGTGLTATPNPITSTGTISLVTPVTVVDGGTGGASLAAYAVVCGGTTNTSPMQSVMGLGTAGQVLTSAGAAALPVWSSLAAGKLIQIVQSAYTAPAVYQIGITPVDVGLSIAITPTSASSKILILGYMSLVTRPSSIYGWFNLLRGSTPVIRGDSVSTAQRAFGSLPGSSWIGPSNNGTVPLIYLDSPATTSLTTYKIQAFTYQNGSPGSQQVAVNRPDNPPSSNTTGVTTSILIAVEIG